MGAMLPREASILSFSTDDRNTCRNPARQRTFMHPSRVHPASPGQKRQGSPAVVRQNRICLRNRGALDLGAVEATERLRRLGASYQGATGFVAVLASKKSREDALKAFADLQRYGQVLGTEAADVLGDNLGDKGLWYRVVVGPPGSRGRNRFVQPVQSRREILSRVPCGIGADYAI